MKCSQCLAGEVVAAKKVNNVFYVLCEECEQKMIAASTKEKEDKNDHS